MLTCQAIPVHAARLALLAGVAVLAGCLTDFTVSNLPHADVATADGTADGTVTVDSGDLDAIDESVDADIDADDARNRDARHDVRPDSSCGDCLGTNMLCCDTSCVNITLDPDHCGGCAIACLGTTCNGGSCTGTCRMGRLDCDGNVVNGCEVDAATDSRNCGACGRPCNAMQTCVGGVCQCMAPMANCSGTTGGACSTNLTTDAQNCGACGNHCASGQACVAGACVCAPNFQDCDNNPANGCEVSTLSDAMNCGMCTHNCGANSTCVMGTCQCEMGFLRCPATAPGCTTSATDPMTCGTCTNACPLAMPVCAGAACATGCASGQTRCGNSCVDTTSDVTNCGMCGTSCPPRANSVTRCNAGVCGFACLPGFEDCNHDPTDGCEANTQTSTTNCGTCGNACGAAQLCVMGACRCPTGLLNCGGGRCAACCTNTDCNDGNACNTHVCTPSGTCNNAPACSGATSHCCGATVGCAGCCNDGDCSGLSGNFGCAPNGTCTTCAAGFRHCGPPPMTACETNVTTDVNNCGTCMNVCSFANATASCSGGVCRLGMCHPGFADCNGMPADGCEVNLNSSTANCGACGAACTITGQVCMNGMCVMGMCPPGSAHCGPNPNSGCDTNTSTDVNNCGSCNTRCQFANAGATCAGGVCMLGACNNGFGNCDGMAANGCETNLQTDQNNCGTCAMACSLPNATSTCTAGACAIVSCSNGFGDCNHTASDGCEASLSSNQANCGACGTICPAVTNADATCGNGRCGYACRPNFLDCDGDSGNGCEVNGTVDSRNCGMCQTSCPSVSSASQLCEGGSCGFSCNAGFNNCDGNLANGCESNPQTDVNNCGGCGNACHGAPNATPGPCVSGACQYTCTAGWGDCDGNTANGCETNIAIDPAHCGACNNAVCSGLSANCSRGACMAFCQSGEMLCGHSCINLQRDRNNCGMCGHVCGDDQNCNNGNCVTTTCSGSRTDLCRGQCTTRSFDNLNCGTCGTVCTQNQSCVFGVCRAAGDECLDAIAVSLSTGPVRVMGNTTGFTNSGFGCGAAPDAWYRFTLARRELVYINTFGSSFAAVVGVPPTPSGAIGNPCAMPPACTGASCPGAMGQYWVGTLDAGTHDVIVDGANAGDAGAFVLNIQHIPVALAPRATLSPSFTVSGSTADGMATNTAGTCGPGPDYSYYWTTCPSDPGGTLNASVCGGASWDTVLQLLNGDIQGGGCNDNACLQQSRLAAPVSAGAGLHVLFIDGSNSSSSGSYIIAGTRP